MLASPFIIAKSQSPWQSQSGMEQLIAYLLGVGSHWLLQVFAIAITALLIPRLRVTSIFGPLLTVMALALLNATIWDAALFFRVPDSFSVQVLLLLISNGIFFWILVKLLPGIEVNGLLPAIAAPIVFTLVSILLSVLSEYVDWIELAKYLIKEIEGLRAYFQQVPSVPGAS